MQFNENDIKYTIDEENRIVTGEYTFSPSGVEKEMTNLLAKSFANQNMFKSLGVEPLHNPSMTWYEHIKFFKATAKCHPDDTFDAEYGKKLVKYRLLKKFYNEKAYIMNAYLKILCDQSRRVREAMNCLEKGRFIIDDIIKSFDGDANE